MSNWLMPTLLRRSLLQAIAAVVLFACAGGADVFAGTTQTVAATTNGSAPATVVFTLWRRVYAPGVPPAWQLVTVWDNNANPPGEDIDGRMNLPVVSTTPGGGGNNTYIYGTTLTGLTPGVSYAYVCENQVGNPAYYSTLQTVYWTQP